MKFKDSNIAFNIQRATLENQIGQCLAQDRSPLLAMLEAVDIANLVELQKLQGRIQDALDRKIQRVTCIHRVKFTMDLPIHARLDDIRQALHGHQVVVICGETGSGKTTQIPKLCLDLNRGSDGVIGHTQPRRIAAKTVAVRIAEELGVAPGQLVGYRIRHIDKTSDATRIKVMTDGILLAELQHDRRLERYDTLIIDEAHERSLNIDFILGYLKQLLPQRPDLKVIITSATIDTERFSGHFGGAPVIEVSSRGYPVEVRYRPVAVISEETEERVDADDAIFLAIRNVIRELARTGQGDILIFLEGEREIHELTRFLKRQIIRDTDILPLYSRLNSAQQAVIFKPHNRRHIVLATNVAETSLTIPGIHYVIDIGNACISRYNRRSKVQQLPVEKISQASAEQRKGRCGRIAAGICVRLYSEEDFQSRPLFTEPEILRTSLASVILQMKALQLGDVHDFPFLDQPDMRYVNDGLRLLTELGAVDHNEDLTRTGRQLARLPLDPRLGRVLLAAGELGCLREILVIVSALSMQDPRERPLDAQEQADEAHARFRDERSDFLTLLKLWGFYDECARTLGANKLHKLCRQNFLSATRMREWREVHRQLLELSAGLGLHLNAEQADYNRIHSALLTGLLSHIAVKTDGKEYTGARGVKLNIFPGSGQFHKLPQWMVCGELLETSKLYARNVAAIDAQWVLRPAAHLLQKEYFEPYWDSNAQQVFAHERIKLFGLMLVERQRVNYGRVNPVEARQIFIRRALVDRDYHTRAGFFEYNNSMVQELKLLEQKSRRHDVFNEDALYEFYERKVPSGICNGPAFEKWLAVDTDKERDLMLPGKEVIMYHAAEDITPVRFPDVLPAGDNQLPLTYRFMPGEGDDGITVQVPLPILNQINQDQLDYLVPGLLEEKIILMLKGLPKQIRRNLAPILATARECAENINADTGGLAIALAQYLLQSRGMTIDMTEWEQAGIPDYLQMNIRVLDETLAVIAQGRDLRKLQHELSGMVQDCFSNFSAGSYPRTGIQQWDFEDLPETLTVNVNNTPLTGYPALLDRQQSVSLLIYDSRDQAAAAMQAGVKRLFMLELKKEFGYLKKNLPRIREMSLFYLTLGTRDELQQDLLVLIAERVFLFDRADLRSREDYIKRRDAGLRVLFTEADIFCNLAYEILRRYHALRQRLENDIPSGYAATAEDIHEHLEYLVHKGFLVMADAILLQHYPRYLDAAGRRIDKLSYAPQKDEKQLMKIKLFQEANKTFSGAAADTGSLSREIRTYRWMLEEYRVSLFAQELGTAMTVSATRLQDQLDIIRRESGRMRKQWHAFTMQRDWQYDR